MHTHSELPLTFNVVDATEGGPFINFQIGVCRENCLILASYFKEEANKKLETDSSMLSDHIFLLAEQLHTGILAHTIRYPI